MTMHARLLPLLLITSTLLIGGCKKVEPAADAPVENSVPEGDEVTAEAPELPKADYWKPLASHLAGSYTGNCRRTAEGAKNEASTLLIGADGKYTFKEYAGDLHASSQSLFFRKHNADGSVSLNFSATWEDGLLGLMTDDKGGYNINFAKSQKQEIDLKSTFGCDPTKGTLPMAAKPLHTIFASVMETGAGKLQCVLPGSMMPASVAYNFKNGVLNVGSLKFDISKMDETVNISENFSQLLYTAMVEGEGSVSLGFDQYGKIMMVMATGKEDKTISCQKE
jgi:hypothetical protein